jgi:hypothetical protein
VVELVMSAIAAAAIVLRLGITASMSRFTLGERAQGLGAGDQTVFAFVMVASTIAFAVGFALLDPLASLLGVSRTVAAIGLVGLWVTMNYDVVARILPHRAPRPASWCSRSERRRHRGDDAGAGDRPPREGGRVDAGQLRRQRAGVRLPAGGPPAYGRLPPLRP